MLQGTFRPLEPISRVYDFARAHLHASIASFELCTPRL